MAGDGEKLVAHGDRLGGAPEELRVVDRERGTARQLLADGQIVSVVRRPVRPRQRQHADRTPARHQGSDDHRLDPQRRQRLELRLVDREIAKRFGAETADENRGPRFEGRAKRGRCARRAAIPFNRGKALGFERSLCRRYGDRRDAPLFEQVHGAQVREPLDGQAREVHEGRVDLERLRQQDARICEKPKAFGRTQLPFEETGALERHRGAVGDIFHEAEVLATKRFELDGSERAHDPDRPAPNEQGRHDEAPEPELARQGGERGPQPLDRRGSEDLGLAATQDLLGNRPRLKPEDETDQRLQTPLDILVDRRASADNERAVRRFERHEHSRAHHLRERTGDALDIELCRQRLRCVRDEAQTRSLRVGVALQPSMLDRAGHTRGDLLDEVPVDSIVRTPVGTEHDDAEGLASHPQRGDDEGAGAERSKEERVDGFAGPRSGPVVGQELAQPGADDPCVYTPAVLAADRAPGRLARCGLCPLQRRAGRRGRAKLAPLDELDGAPVPHGWHQRTGDLRERRIAVEGLR